MADLISDKQWTTKMQELFTVAPAEPTGDFADDDVDEDSIGDEPGFTQAERIFDVLEERKDALDDLYPFEFVQGRLEPLISIEAAQESPYVALLCITLAHAHKIDTPVDPKRVLEDSVVRSLTANGLIAVNVGEVSRGLRDFRDTVVRVGTAIGLRPTPDAGVSNLRAMDEGVDAIAHLSWDDARAGSWVYIGQVTCGKSDTWPAKIAQPSRPSWKAYLNAGVHPVGFLAVPHHVESRHLTKLVQDADRIVLDRLRLVRFRTETSPDEKSLIVAVGDAGVEPLD